jgi:ABC-type dipeptide/oligopeptide/nickel transport system ATPase component
MLRFSQLKSIPFDVLIFNFIDEGSLIVYKNRCIFDKKCLAKSKIDTRYLHFHNKGFKDNEVNDALNSGFIFEFVSEKNKEQLEVYEYNGKQQYSDPNNGWTPLNRYNKVGNRQEMENDKIRLSLEKKIKLCENKLYEKSYPENPKKSYGFIESEGKIISNKDIKFFTDLPEEELLDRVHNFENYIANYMAPDPYEGNPFESYLPSDKLAELGLLRVALMCKKSGITLPTDELGLVILRGSAKNPPQFAHLINNIPIFFIVTNRLIQILSKESYKNTLISKSNDLKDRIKEANEKYNEKARSQEKTYLGRLVSRAKKGEIVDKTELIKKYDDINKKQILLKKRDFLITSEKAITKADLNKYLNNNQNPLPISLFLDDTLEKIELFVDIMDRWEIFTKNIEKFFKNKTVEFSQEDGIVFFDTEKIPDNQKPLKLLPEQLSSGEMHLVVILFDFIFNIPNGSLVLIDEPELSLHVSWQIEFIRSIKEIIDIRGKENIQVLIATHSPQIIHDRWDLTIGLGVRE